MYDADPIVLQMAAVGLLTGIMLGAAARITDFCTLGALETALFGRDTRRIHLWGVALGVAILATQLGAAFGIANLRATMFYSFAWSPAASISGGLVFGYGMALAGNCGFGATLRAASGDIRSIILLVVIGIMTHVTLSGPLGPIRAAIFPQWEQTGPSGIGYAFAATTGLPAAFLFIPLSAGLIGWGLRHPGVGRSASALIGSVGVGLSVALALIGTSLIKDHSVAAYAVEGPSFTAPLGRTIMYLMTSTGVLPSFSIGAVLGTLFGAFGAVLLRGEFQWEACDDPRELGRQMWGAVLMGIGGAVAMGCTVGQGLSGFATLSWSGPVTLIAICAGAWVGLLRMIAQAEI